MRGGRKCRKGENSVKSIYDMNEGKKKETDLGTLHCIIYGVYAKGKTVRGCNFLQLF